MRHRLMAAFCGALLVLPIHASIIIPKPIGDLYEQADLVALITVTSGHLEHSGSAIYQASVTKAFKGAQVGTELCFTTLSPHAIGASYLAFLERAEKAQNKSGVQGKSDGLKYSCQRVYEPLNSGISTALWRECGISVAFTCEDAYKVDSIVVPDGLMRFSQKHVGVPRDATWVRATEIDALLLEMAERPGR